MAILSGPIAWSALIVGLCGQLLRGPTLTPEAEEIHGTPKLSEKHVSRESPKQYFYNNS
jgi:hypothetical protein